MVARPGQTIRHLASQTVGQLHGQNHDTYDRWDWYYEDLGRRWAEELRRERMRWDQLLASIQEEILVAPAGA